jgi:predicted transcriptional regulator
MMILIECTDAHHRFNRVFVVLVKEMCNAKIKKLTQEAMLYQEVKDERELQC